MLTTLALVGVLMAADPITGLETGDGRTQDVLDYLGRRSPVAFAQQTALPSVQGPSPSSGPSGPGGAGVTLGGGQGARATSPTDGAPGTDTAALALNILGQSIGGAKGATQALKTVFGGEPPESISAQEGVFRGVPPSGPVDVEVGVPADSITAPAGVFKGVQPTGPVDVEGGAGASGLLDLAGLGLSGAGLLALIAQLAESGQITPRQAAALLQTSGGTATGAAATLGPAKAGETAGVLSGTLSPEVSAALGLGGEVLGGAGALGSVALSLKNEFDALRAGREDPRQYASAAGSELGLAAGGIIGSWILPGYGTLIGLGAGGAAGTAAGQAIARNLPKTHYMAQQEHVGEVAQDALNAYGFAIEKAAAESGLFGVQQALSQKFADGHVQAFMTLPESIAQAIGVSAYAPFDSMSPTQFLTFLKAWSERDPDEQRRWIGASGDVPHLEQDRAQAVSEGARSTAVATLNALAEQMAPILSQLPTVDPEGLAAGRAWAAGAPERERLRLEGLVAPPLVTGSQE